MLLLLMFIGYTNTEEKQIDYFLKYQHINGCVQDRASSDKIYSCAASGFAMDVYAIAATKHIITNQEAERRIRLILQFYAKLPTKNRGWLFHFHDSSGNPILNEEISSVDTAIFYVGAKQAAIRLKNYDLEKEVNDRIHKIDLQWMIYNSPSKKLICHGLIKDHFIPYEWDDYNEGILVYKLFEMKFYPQKTNYNLPLFVYYYPLCFMDSEIQKTNLLLAIEYQKRTYGFYGITSCDTEHGYMFYPADYVSPLALYSIEPFYKDHPKYPLVQSISLKNNWKSNDWIGIDVGAAILLRNKL